MAGVPPSDPYYPYRKYSDDPPGGLGWTFTDTTRFYKNKIRSFFTKGQQLYDQDWNNNVSWWSLWMNQWAFYRRNYPSQVPPYYSRNERRFVLDTKWYDGQSHRNFINQNVLTQGLNYWYAPMRGAKAWIDADRMMTIYGVNGWTPIARLEDPQWNVEIAIFLQGGKKGEVVAQKIVSQPFRLPKEQAGTRARDLSEKYPYRILKNGLGVALLVKSTYTISISQSADIDFEAGDVLTIVANENNGANSVSISLVGTLL